MNKKLIFATVCVLILFQGCSSPSPAPVVKPTKTATLATSTSTPMPTATSTSTPTPIPLAWTQISDGRDFERDTITAIALDPEKPDVLYVGTENSGIYKSIDGGDSWLPSYNGLSATRVDSLVIDPTNPNTLFAGVLLDDVYKSTDGGEHWQKSNIASQSASISQVVMDPNNSLHLLYLSDQIHETMDGGQTWQANIISGCPQDIQNLIFNPADSLILYASDGGGSSCDAGVYKSSDGGKTWSLIGLKGEKVSSGALQIDKQTGNTLYAAIENNLVYSSTNGGETWEQHLVYSCSAIVIHPTNSKTVYCMSQNGLGKTADGGKSWGKIMTYGGWDFIVTLSFSPQNPDVLYLGRKGLFTSTNGGDTWAEISNGLGNNPVSLILDPTQNTNLYALDSSCVFQKPGPFANFFHVSSDGGKTWKRIVDMDMERRLCSPAFDADGVAHYWVKSHRGVQGDFAYRMKNDWENPQQISHAGWDVFSIAANPHQAGNLLVTFYRENPNEGNIALSTEGGVTWESISQVNWLEWRDSPSQFFFDHNSGQVIYAVPKEGDIYRSENGGKTWGTCGKPSIQVYGYDSPLAIDLSDSSQVYLATQGKGILISADGCQTWQPSGLSDLFVNTVVIDPNNPDILYAGTDSGAYATYDGGATWNQINDGLPDTTVVYSIAVDSESNVYAATPYGMFKLEGR